jgi:hypothetical protein
VLLTAFPLKAQRRQGTFFPGALSGGLDCFATGEAVMSTESEFFRMKSSVACVIRCEAMIFAELMT